MRKRTLMALLTKVGTPQSPIVELSYDGDGLLITIEARAEARAEAGARGTVGQGPSGAEAENQLRGPSALPQADTLSAGCG